MIFRSAVRNAIEAIGLNRAEAMFRSGLYAAGGLVRGFKQVVVAMGHAAVGAMDIHNRCELPNEDEVGGAEGQPAPA